MKNLATFLGRSLGAWLVIGSTSAVWAQVCNLADPASGAGLVETGFNNGVDADLDGVADPDPNGGWNVTPVAFSELGAQVVGSTFRFTGDVGTFVPLNGTSASSRDLDWLRFSVPEACYLEVTLSMGRIVDGAPVGFAGGEQSYLSMYSGSVQASAKALVMGDSGRAWSRPAMTRCAERLSVSSILTAATLPRAPTAFSQASRKIAVSCSLA